MFLGLNLNENLSRKFHMIALLKKLRSYCVFGLFLNFDTI